MDGPHLGTAGCHRYHPLSSSELPRSRLLVLVLLTVMVGMLVCGGCGGRHRVPASRDDSPSARTSPAAADWMRHSQRIAAGVPLLIRVGLATDLSAVNVTTSGPTRLLAGDQRREVVSLQKGEHIELRPSGRGVRWQAGGQGGEAEVCFIAPRDPDHLLTWNDTPYRGELLGLPAGGKVTLVNVLELETYLQGVVPWEIGRPGAEAKAAVEAQAVAARTYTISHLGEREDFGFDVWASVQDQVYRGAHGEDVVCNVAISATVGLVLRSGGHEIEAYYSSTCGGRTSNVDEVWPRPARSYLISHRDSMGDGPPFCAGATYFNWQVAWSAHELEQILQRTLPEYVAYISSSGTRTEWAGRVFTPRSADARPEKPGRLRDLAVISRTTSGRVGRLDVTTDAGVYHVRGDRIRWVLEPPGGDPAILRSALCELVVTRDAGGQPLRIVVTGQGYGHGVGMCQEGSLAMARSGYSSRSILAHYYPGTRLEPFAAGAP